MTKEEVTNQGAVLADALTALIMAAFAAGKKDDVQALWKVLTTAGERIVDIHAAMTNRAARAEKRIEELEASK